MPQLDSVSFFSQVFWFLFLFFFFYSFLLHNILEDVLKVFRVRSFYLGNSSNYYHDICKQSILYSSFFYNYYVNISKTLIFFYVDILDSNFKNITNYLLENTNA